MRNLSDIIFEQKGYLNDGGLIDLSMDSTDMLRIMVNLPSPDNPRYIFIGDIDGRGYLPDQNNNILLSEFLEGVGVGVISPMSGIYVALKNEQSIQISHSPLPHIGQHFYEINFLSQRGEATHHTSMLTDIAESAYGLVLNGQDYDPQKWPGPFIQKQDLSKGVAVGVTSGLKYETTPEKDARQVIQRITPQLFDDELEKLRRYDKALTDDMSTSNEVKGYVLQTGGDLQIDGFVNLLGNIPEELVEISLYVMGADSKYVNLNSGRNTGNLGNPHMRVQLFSENSEDIYRLIDHVWSVYSKLTGASLEAAELQLKIT